MGNVEKNFMEIVNLIVDAVKTVTEKLKDGFQYSDLVALIPVLMQIEPAIKDADHALNYLKDMTTEKRQDIINAVMEKLGSDANENLKEGVTRILDAAASDYMLVKWAMGNAATADGTEAAGG